MAYGKQIATPQSSNVDSFNYDSEDGTLYVIFKGGGAYYYQSVPYGVYEGLVNAPSKGKYLNEFVKPKYAFTKGQFAARKPRALPQHNTRR